MVCDKCESCKESGFKFCIKCGMDLSGNEPVPTEAEYNRILSESNLRASVIPAAFYIAIGMMICIALAVYYSLDTFNYVKTYNFTLYLFIPLEWEIVTISGIWIQTFWILILMGLVASSAAVLWQSRGMFSIKWDGYADRIRDTPVYWIGFLLCGVTIIELVTVLLSAVAGADVSTPVDFMQWDIEKMLFQFGEAAVWEEIAFRLVPFGLPMMVAALLCRQKDFLKYPLGGFGVSKLSLVLLFISAIIFGYAHVGGWGLWKMVPASLGGLVFGYLYMRFGIHASIVGHMVNDFIVVWMKYDISLSTLEIWLILAGLVCLPALLIYTYRGIKRVKELPSTGFVDYDGIDQDDSN